MGSNFVTGRKSRRKKLISGRKKTAKKLISGVKRRKNILTKRRARVPRVKF